MAAISAGVRGRVGVERLAPTARDREPDAVAVPLDGGEVQHDDDVRVRRIAAAQPGENLVVRGFDEQPLEPAPVGIEAVQGGLGTVEAVEVAHERLHARAARVRERAPVELARVIPLGALRDLLPHEQQLLAGVCPHVAVERLEPAELVGVTAGHTGVEGSLAVHDLVVADGQHEFLAERVGDAEGEQVVVVAAVDRIRAEVGERVVHPAEVPLVIEPEPAVVHAARDAGEGGRFLGGHGGAVGSLFDRVVRLAQEAHGLVVLAATVAIGDPPAVVAGVVAIEHAGDGVDAQAVEVVLLEPVQRVGDEVAADLAATVVEDQGVPVGVEPLARILMLVERRAVEAAEAVRVGGEVGGHPVGDDAEALLMGRIDERCELGGRAVADRGRVHADGLVPPGSVEGVLGDRQYLDVGEPEVCDVIDELGRELEVRQ